MSKTYQELSQKVEKGELTWQQILNEIKRIKTETEICKSIANLDALIRFNTSSEIDSLCNEMYDTHKYLMRKECWEKLSKDAKLVAQIVLRASHEDWRSNRFGKELFHKNKITKRRIDAVMRRHYRWSVIRVKKTLIELNQYCRDIE